VVQCYVVPLRTTQRIAYVVFFSAEKHIRWKQGALDDVARSVELAE
jgi:hypothetical protein